MYIKYITDGRFRTKENLKSLTKKYQVINKFYQQDPKKKLKTRSRALKHLKTTGSRAVITWTGAHSACQNKLLQSSCYGGGMGKFYHPDSFK